MENEKKVLVASDMDVLGTLFGIRFVDGCGANKCAELYIEDDEHYHFKCLFNSLWLADLERVVTKARIKVQQPHS